MAGPLENLTIGTVSYAGITFNAYNSSKVIATPQYDEARRTVIWVDYALEIVGWLDNGGLSTDGLLDTWRQSLLTPGQQLQYTQKGFGTFQVNYPGGAQDAAWGPTPELLSFEPYSNLGCKIHWKVTGRFASCPTAQYVKALAALNFDVSWDCDGTTGLTKRTISGYLEIPLTRLNGGRTLQDQADAYWEQFYPEAPLGFRRSHSRQIDKSKRRLTFTISDEEMWAPLPDGVLTGQVRHSISAGIDTGFNQWRGTISASFNMSRDGFSKADAWQRFQMIAGSRLENPDALALGKKLRKVAVKPGGSVTMPTGLDISEDDIFGPTTNITLRYLIMGVGLDQILSISGMWQPVPGVTWSSWRRSLRNIFGARSTAQLGFKASDDLIIDLCKPKKPKKPDSQANVKNPRKAPKQAGAGKARGDPNRGWIRFRNVFKYIVDGRVITHTPLGSVGSYNGPAKGPPPDKDGNAYEATGVVDIGIKATTFLILQKVTTPIIKIIMEGDGVRVGDKVLVPMVREVAGQPVTLEDSDIDDNEVIGGDQGMPVYRSTWRMRYAVKLPPREALPALANPALGTDGGPAPQNLGN